jgi:hypothetical protein
VRIGFLRFHLESDLLKRRGERRLPARRPRYLRARAVEPVRIEHRQRARGHVGCRRAAHLRVALLEFVQQVVPAVPRHDVEQQQPAAHHAGLGAGRRAGQRDDQVGGGHQLGDPVGEAERPDRGPGGGQLTELPFDPGVAARDRQHVHAGGGQPRRRPGQRGESPAAVDEQHAAAVPREAEGLPGVLLAGRLVKSRADRGRDERDRRPGPEPADRRGRGRGADQEQVGALVHPHLVRGDVRAVHHRLEVRRRQRPRRRRGRLERGRGERPGREDAQHQVGGCAVQLRAQRGDHATRGGALGDTGDPAPGAQLREVQPVVHAGDGHQPVEHPLPGPAGRGAEQRHAVAGADPPAGALEHIAETAHGHFVA